MKRFFGRLKLSTISFSILLLLLNACVPDSPGNKTVNNNGVIINGTEVPPVADLIPENISEGEQLYMEYCASCHGSNLEGALNWKIPLEDGTLPAPPQDNSGHTWHHSDAILQRIVLEGGAKLYGGTMPAFDDQLTQEQAAMILDYFKSQWGKDEREYQWWITVTENK
jgi:cytochrome c